MTLDDALARAKAGLLDAGLTGGAGGPALDLAEMIVATHLLKACLAGYQEAMAIARGEAEP